MKKRPVTIHKTEVLVKEREDKWYVPPSAGIPEYTSEKDPHCPTGQIRKYNQEKKLKADILAQRDKATSSFIKNTLNHSTEEIKWDVNVKSKSDIRSKVKTHEGFIESTILQKIIIREKLLTELQTLLKTQNDVSSCLSEVVELVKAIRFQTLDVVEGIRSWQQMLPAVQGFDYKGYNYLVKMKCDLDFLDLYEEVVEKFCFEFTSNPLAYRGGGNVITGYGVEQRGKSYGQGLLHNCYTSSDEEFLNGLSVQRLLSAEKIIQDEFVRLRREKLSGEELQRMQQQQYQTQQGQGQQGDVLDRDIFSALSKSVTNLHEIDASNAGNNVGGVPAADSADSPAIRGGKKDKGKEKKTRRSSKLTAAINPKKLKQDRITALQEEAAELKAMMVNVDEKVKFLTDHHYDLLNQRAVLDTRLKEAKAASREVAAQHIAAEISVNTAVVLENSGKVKDLQRESYFINLERKRKLGTAQKLKEEIEDDKRRAALQKKIGAKIRKEGLLAALQSFSTKVTVEEIATIGDKALGVVRPKTPSGLSGSGLHVSPSKSAGGASSRRPKDISPQQPQQQQESHGSSPTTRDAGDPLRSSSSAGGGAGAGGSGSGARNKHAGVEERAMYSSASAPQFSQQHHKNHDAEGTSFPPAAPSGNPGHNHSHQHQHQSRAFPSHIPPNPGYNGGSVDRDDVGEEEEEYDDDNEDDGGNEEEEEEDGEENDNGVYGNYVDGNDGEINQGGRGNSMPEFNHSGQERKQMGQYNQDHQDHQQLQQQYPYYGGDAEGQAPSYQKEPQRIYHHEAQDPGQSELYYGEGYHQVEGDSQYFNGSHDSSRIPHISEADSISRNSSNYYQNNQYQYQAEYTWYSAPAYGESQSSYQASSEQYSQGGGDYDHNSLCYTSCGPTEESHGVFSDLETSPQRHQVYPDSNNARRPGESFGSPSDASCGSKESPLGYNYPSTFEDLEPASIVLVSESEVVAVDGEEEDDAHHADLLVGEQLLATPVKHKHTLKFKQAAENEMYISDDEEGHDSSVGGKYSARSKGAARADVPVPQQHEQREHCSHTFDLSEMSPSPSSLISLVAFDRSFDSDVGIVENNGEDENGDKPPVPEPVAGSPAVAAGQVTGEAEAAEVGEVAYPAGNAYALVKSLKLSPRPNN